MNKIQKISISVLLILAAIVIQFLLDDSGKLDEELISFLAGFCFAGGIFMFFSAFFKKKV
jgi:hypothetical protein